VQNRSTCRNCAKRDYIGCTLSVSPISNISYLSDSARARRKIGTAYYADSKSERAGIWWAPAGWMARDATVVKAAHVKRLAEGRDPVSGEKIVVGKGEKKRAGFDLTFSAPKCFSSLWAVSDSHGRAMLDSMLEAAVRETLEEIHQRGLIEARRGKGGKIREPVSAFIAALYGHDTSRAGDPQRHVHAFIPMFGLRADGSIGAVNNERLMDLKMVLGAAFRLRLAEKLESAGIPVVADEKHGFRIDGENTQLLKTWSKRTATIEAAKKPYESYKDSRLTMRKTRGKKSDLPSRRDLEDRWQVEAWRAGWTPGDEWSRLDRPAITRSPADEAKAARQIVHEAIMQVTEKNSLFLKKEIEALALTLAVGRSNISAIRDEISRLEGMATIIETGQDGLLTTREIIAQEREIVAISRSRQNDQSAGFSMAATTAALADKKYSDEQRNAIRHALSSAGVAVVEGGPGVGKTTAARAIAAACKVDRRRLILAAPSWTATETLKMELGHTGMAVALDKLSHDVKTHKLQLQRGDVILVDEAGMTSTAQILALMRHAAAAGATVRLQGDSAQIAAVSRGDPLALISSAIGGVEIRHIRRQRIEWQRQASMDAQSGEVAKAIGAYATRGDVQVADDTESALEAAALAFRQAGGDAHAIASTNAKVAELNARLRQEVADLGLLHGPEIVIRAIPRGGDKVADLPLRAGDRLILGGEVRLGETTLRNATRISVIGVMPKNRSVILDIDGQQILVKAGDLERAGAGGRPLIAQHAYAVTAHASQGATWGRTIWLPSHEDRRSALVAMTRHTDQLSVIIDRSAVPRPTEASLSVGQSNMADPDEAPDERSADEIIEAVGRSMQRDTRPRNALDLIGMPAQGQTVPRRLPGGSVAASRQAVAMLPVRRPGAALEAATVQRDIAPVPAERQAQAHGSEAARPAAKRSIFEPPPGFVSALAGPIRTPIREYPSAAEEYAPGR